MSHNRKPRELDCRGHNFLRLWWSWRLQKHSRKVWGSMPPERPRVLYTTSLRPQPTARAQSTLTVLKPVSEGRMSPRTFRPCPPTLVVLLLGRTHERAMERKVSWVFSVKYKREQYGRRFRTDLEVWHRDGMPISLDKIARSEPEGHTKQITVLECELNLDWIGWYIICLVSCHMWKKLRRSLAGETKLTDKIYASTTPAVFTRTPGTRLRLRWTEVLLLYRAL